jgi:Arc/MetJ-type ribon-helix-helix transcriptional regulator
MKVSVSLPGEDVEFLDTYALEHDLASRSAAVQRAIRSLRVAELGAAYQGAWDEWGVSDWSKAWDTTSADGLPD